MSEELLRQKQEVSKAVRDFVDNMTEKTDNPIVITEATVRLASASILALRHMGENKVADAFVELFILETCRAEDFLRISGGILVKMGESLRELKEEERKKEKEKRERGGGDEKNEEERDK